MTHLVHLVRSAALGRTDAALWISALVLIAYAAALIPLGILRMRRKLIR